MGVLSRTSTIVKSKMNKLLDRAEDPREQLDYAYDKLDVPFAFGLEVYDAHAPALRAGASYSETGLPNEHTPACSARY